jgi:hypothetical protein
MRQPIELHEHVDLALRVGAVGWAPVLGFPLHAPASTTTATEAMRSIRTETSFMLGARLWSLSGSAAIRLDSSHAVHVVQESRSERALSDVACDSGVHLSLDRRS